MFHKIFSVINSIYSGHQLFSYCKSKSAFTVPHSNGKTCGRFVEQKLMLSSNFRCDQIYKNERYDFGHTLLCYLSPTIDIEGVK
jgi:hypothetical protein